jgi:hypothetical protein
MLNRKMQPNISERWLSHLKDQLLLLYDVSFQSNDHDRASDIKSSLREKESVSVVETSSILN